MKRSYDGQFKARRSAPKTKTTKEITTKRYIPTVKPRFDPFKLPLGGMPASKMVRLRYAEEFNLNPPSSGPVAYTFSANGAYDPNITGVGHQPNGFDQMMQFYNHYQVIKSKCMAKFTATTTGNIVPAYMDVLLTDSGSRVVAMSTYDFLEHATGRGDGYQVGTERNYIGQPSGITKYFDSKKFFRRKENDSSLLGTIGSNPPEQAYFEVALCPIAANNPEVVNCLVLIDYIIMFTEPKQVLVS